MIADGPVWVRVVGADPETLPAPDGVTLTTERSGVDMALAVGEPALLELATGDVPVLPVEAGTGVRSVPRADLRDALTSVRDGSDTVWTAPRLSVAIDGEQVSEALFDVMLVTEAPAHISEFSVATPTDDLATFRADGVLVATAAGTGGYARRVEAPVFEPTVPAAAVVPVAPFATTLDHWVVSTAGDEPIVEAAVERDEAAVVLLADDRTVGPVPPHTPVTVTVDDHVELVRVPESDSCFRTRRRSPRDGSER